MSPFEHGEVFVLDDGGEVRSAANLACTTHIKCYSLSHTHSSATELQVDLDLGNYERFLDISLTRKHNLTTGKVYQV